MGTMKVREPNGPWAILTLTDDGWSSDDNPEIAKLFNALFPLSGRWGGDPLARAFSDAKTQWGENAIIVTAPIVKPYPKQ